MPESNIRQRDIDYLWLEWVL